MTTKSKSRRLSVSLSEEDHRQIEALAARLDRSASWIGAQAIRLLLAEGEGAARRLTGAPDER